MSWLPWMRDADPSDGWYSDAQLDAQRAAEREEREFRDARAPVFELTVALLDEPTDAGGARGVGAGRLLGAG